MEEQNMRDIVKLMNKTKTAIEIVREKQSTINILEGIIENETRPLIAEKMKLDMEKAKEDKKDFDEMTTNSIINAKLTIQKLRNELEEEYKNKLLEKIDKQRKLEEKVNAMKMHETSSDRLLHIDEMAKKSAEKIEEETNEYSKKHFVKINKLNEFDQNLKDWSVELNVVEAFNNAKLQNEEETIKEDDSVDKDLKGKEENNSIEKESKEENPATDIDKSFEDLKKELNEQFKKLQEDIEKGFEIPELSSDEKQEVKDEANINEEDTKNIEELINSAETPLRNIENIEEIKNNNTITESENQPEEIKNNNIITEFENQPEENENNNIITEFENQIEENETLEEPILKNFNLSFDDDILSESQSKYGDLGSNNLQGETTKTLTTVDKNNEKGLPAISFSEVLAKINTVHVSSFAYSMYKAANKKINFKNKNNLQRLASIPSFIGKILSMPINYALRTNAKIYEIKDNIEQLSNEEFTVLTEKPEVANKYGQNIKNESDQTLSDKNVMKDRHVNDAILDCVQERLEEKYSKNNDLYNSKINELDNDIKNYEESMKADPRNSDTYNLNIETLKTRREAWEKEIQDQDKRLQTYKKNKRIKEAYRNNPDVREFDHSIGEASQKLREAKNNGDFIYEAQLSRAISKALSINKDLHENPLIQKMFYGEASTGKLEVDAIINKEKRSSEKATDVRDSSEINNKVNIEEDIDR